MRLISDLAPPKFFLPSAFCLLPFAFCLLPFAFCLLPSAFCLLPFAFCLLPFAFCLLPFAFCLLPSAFCLVPFAFCLQPSAFSLLPFALTFPIANIATPINSPPIAVLQFISIFCPVVNGVLAVFCLVGVRLLSASKFGSAPGIELISF
jgi:hypothetical protein